MWNTLELTQLEKGNVSHETHQTKATPLFHVKLKTCKNYLLNENPRTAQTQANKHVYNNMVSRETNPALTKTANHHPYHIIKHNCFTWNN